MNGWPFVHPEFALAAAAVATLPILIHLLNRRRYRVVPWGAMAFLRGAMRRSARRIRIEQWTLLLVRMAVIGLAFLAVARPYFPMLPLAALGSASVHRILLVDNSCSMQASSGPTLGTSFEQALAATESLLDSFPSSDAVSLVTLASPAKAVVGYAAYDRRRVRDELGRLRVTSRGTDLAGALQAVLSVLDDPNVRDSDVVVYVVSDLANTAWSPGAVRAARKVANRVRGGGLVLVSVTRESPTNVAITDVRVDRGDWPGVGASSPSGTSPLRVEATVANFARQSVGGLRLIVSVGDRVARRVPVETLRTNESRTVRFSVASDLIGVRGIKVSTEGGASDALPIDDSRWASVEITPGVGVLIVDGRGADGVTGAGTYLSTALSPGGAAALDTGIRVRTMSTREFATSPTLDRNDISLIALCDVARLDEREWNRLAEFVHDGGGLFVTGGPSVQPDHYTRHGYADGAELLPCSVVDVVTPDQGRSKSVRFASDKFTHPILVDFAEHADSGLFSARVYQYLNVIPHSTRAEVLIRYTDGQPAMVGWSPRGENDQNTGRVIMLTTSSDMTWTNLPAKGDYVSLMANVVGYLAGLRGAERTLTVGATILERLSAAESTLPLRVEDAAGQVIDARLSLSSGAFALEHGPVEQPGAYRLTIGPRSVTYTVNIDSDESDLRRLNEQALRERLKCDFAFVKDSASLDVTVSRATTNEIGGSLLYLVLALIVVESWLATRFGVRR